MIIKDIPIVETAAAVMVLTLLLIGGLLILAHRLLDRRWRDKVD